jgi:DNA invertase Pin-like site-specific DNA recombinase
METMVLNIERAAPAPGGRREITAVAPAGAAGGKLKVAAYVRVSSDSEDQLNSYISQLRHYAALIAENEAWEYADVYADEGLTGLDAAKRPGFQRMLRDCRRGKIDRILTKSVSRFARNLTDCLEAIRELKRVGVSVLFEKEGIDTAQISGEAMLAMQAGAAQRESLSIAGNLRRGVRMRMKTGEFLPSSAPYGYRLNTPARTLEIVPEQAEVVRRIFAAYLAGHGADDIAGILNREGIPKANRISRKDCKPVRWNSRAISYILTNISYTGDAIWQKQYTTDAIPFRSLQNDGKYPRYHVQNSHEPIISHEEFDSVQRLMAGRRRKFYGGAAEPDAGSLLKKTVCCECGSPCRRKTTNGKTYWVCQTHNNKGKHVCPARQVPEAEILAAFGRMWEKLRRHKGEIFIPLIGHLGLIADRKYKCDASIAEVNKDLISLIEQVHALEKLKGKGYIESALYLSQRGELDRKLTALRRTKERLMDEEHDGGAKAAEYLAAALDAGAPDCESFVETVERVTVMAEDSARFLLRCGLELTEPIRREAR